MSKTTNKNHGVLRKVKTLFWTLNLMLCIMMTCCSGKKTTEPPVIPPLPEENFEYRMISNNTEIEITDYIGLYLEVGIPNIIAYRPVTSIGDESFYTKGIKSVTIPNSVARIGIRAFSNNQLTNVTIPDSVTEIGSSAFGNNQLTSVTIPNSVTVIARWAFSSNQLTSVTIGNDVKFPDDTNYGGFGGNFGSVYNGVGGTFTRPTHTSNTWTRMP